MEGFKNDWSGCDECGWMIVFLSFDLNKNFFDRKLFFITFPLISWTRWDCPALNNYCSWLCFFKITKFKVIGLNRQQQQQHWTLLDRGRFTLWLCKMKNCVSVWVLIEDYQSRVTVNANFWQYSYHFSVESININRPADEVSLKHRAWSRQEEQQQRRRLQCHPKCTLTGRVSGSMSGWWWLHKNSKWPEDQQLDWRAIREINVWA